MDVGEGTDFGVYPRATLMGSWGFLPKKRKYGLKPVVEFLGTVVGMDKCSNTALPV